MVFSARAVTKQKVCVYDHPWKIQEMVFFISYTPFMTDDENPDFQALAELWLSRDPRSQELTPEERLKIVSRLATALETRRNSTDHAKQDVELVVNVPREDLEPGKGLSQHALDQLAQIIKERLESRNDEE